MRPRVNLLLGARGYYGDDEKIVVEPSPEIAQRVLGALGQDWEAIDLNTVEITSSTRSPEVEVTWQCRDTLTVEQLNAATAPGGGWAARG